MQPWPERLRHGGRDDLEALATVRVHRGGIRRCGDHRADWLLTAREGKRATRAKGDSKWAGEAPDALETFCKSLAADALDPTFEDYGDFGHEVHRDHWAGILPEKYARYTWTFWGNFLEVAGAFSIFSNHAPTIERIQALIGANQQRADYQAARVEIAERKRKAKEEETRRNIQAAAARGWV
jgi:hypothetical protein